MANTIQSGRRRKAEITVLTNKSGGDTAQVPAVGSTCEVYLQGATVRGSVSIGNGASGTIAISNPGMIEVGDTLQNGTASSPTVTVTAVDRVVVGSKLTWTLTATATGAWSCASDDRLIVTSRRPTIYKDPGDDISYGGSSTTTSSSGLLRFYTKARSADIIVSGGTPSVSAYVIRDVPTADEGFVVNVQDYGGSIVTALDALSNLSDGTGGVVYIPAGVYILDGASELPISTTIPTTFRGDGTEATTIYVEVGNSNKNRDVFNIQGSYCGIEFLTIKGNGEVGTGRGISIGDLSGATTKSTVHVRNVNIFDMSSYGIEIGNISGGMGAADVVEIAHCEIKGSRSNAQLRLGGANTITTVSNSRFFAGGLSGNSPTGVVCIEIGGCANALIENCDGLPPDLSTNAIKTSYTYTNPKDGAANVVIDNCDWELATAPTTETVPLIYLQGVSCAIVRDTILYQFGSGVHFEDCYAPRIENSILKALGGSGYHIKFTDCFYPQSVQNVYEYVDGSPDLGKRVEPTITTAGNNPGLSVYGAGLRIPTYADDNERDTAPGAGTDDKRASTAAGTVIYVVNATTPTSHLQIRHGGAWVGIGDQTGAAI